MGSLDTILEAHRNGIDFLISDTSNRRWASTKLSYTHTTLTLHLTLYRILFITQTLTVYHTLHLLLPLIVLTLLLPYPSSSSLSFLSLLLPRNSS
jgi:hypothetical protein